MRASSFHAVRLRLATRSTAAAAAHQERDQPIADAGAIRNDQRAEHRTFEAVGGHRLEPPDDQDGGGDEQREKQSRRRRAGAFHFGDEWWQRPGRKPIHPHRGNATAGDGASRAGREARSRRSDGARGIFFEHFFRALSKAIEAAENRPKSEKNKLRLAARLAIRWRSAFANLNLA
jgi:hypothetical protein